MTTLQKTRQAATRGRFVDACIELVERSEEPTMRAVARRVGVSERTIYRYFPSREELYGALMPELRRRAHVPMCETFSELPTFVTALYTTFEGNEALVRGLVNGAWAAEFLPKTRAANLAALKALIDARWPTIHEREREAAAACLRVSLSGAGWVYLRDCGFDNAACIGHVHWLLSTIAASFEGGGNA